MSKQRGDLEIMAASKLSIALVGLLLGACASEPPAREAGAKAPPAAERKPEPAPRPAHAEADAAYYRARSKALATEAMDEIARTDFARLRCGRLYVPDAPNGVDLQERLTAAVRAESFAAMAEASAAVLVSDQADIHAHMVRAASLRKMGHVPEADFHRAAAQALLQSIARTGDGRSAQSALVVYRVKEEYELLKVLRARFISQALVSEGSRSFDVLTATTEEGAQVRIYFAIDELLAEEARALQGS